MKYNLKNFIPMWDQASKNDMFTPEGQIPFMRLST